LKAKEENDGEGGGYFESGGEGGHEGIIKEEGGMANGK
jgi:hypothetical protein